MYLKVILKHWEHPLYQTRWLIKEIPNWTSDESVYFREEGIFTYVKSNNEDDAFLKGKKRILDSINKQPWEYELITTRKLLQTTTQA